MRLLTIILMLFVAAAVSGQFNFESPVTVKPRLKEPVGPEGVIVEIMVSHAPDIHVYTSPDQFFEVRTDAASGLSGPDITLPETEMIDNFDGTKSEVLHSSDPVQALWQFSGKEREPWSLKGTFQYQACDATTCFPPTEVSFSFSGSIPAGAVQAQESDSQPETATAPEEDTPLYEQGFLLALLFSFLAGLGLSLTPCVYPMVGITVAVIGSDTNSKKKTIFLTFMYVLGLSIVYGIGGTIIASLGSKAANFFKSAWVLGTIGIIFIAMGLSMFDLFNLQTPSSFAGKIQAAGGKLKGSVLGTLMMGALSAFVVGPCVSGPLIGLISFVAQSSEAVEGTAFTLVLIKGFLFFFTLAWGMSVVLFIAGSSSSALPKAGVWMEKIKHVMGVVLIWAAFYFTRPLRFNTDLLFYTASIVSAAIGLHAAGLLSIPHERKLKSWLVLVLGIALLSGFSVFALQGFQHIEVEVTDFNEYHEGTDLAPDQALMQLIKESDKPVVLDFTASWCTNCKKIKKKVLSRSDISELLRDTWNVVEVDYDKYRQDLAVQFKVIGIPAFIFLDAEGNQIGETIVTGPALEKRLKAKGR